MARESIQVKIFGTEYTLKADTNIDYVKRIAEAVDEKMTKLAENSTIKSPSKLAVLTALNIADELYQFKLKYKKVFENFKSLIPAFDLGVVFEENQHQRKGSLTPGV